MEKQSNLVKDFLFTFWNNKTYENKPELYHLFSPALIINSPLGKKVGKNSLSSINGEWVTAFPDIHIFNVEIEACGKAVVTSWNCTATQTHTFRGLAPTNREINYVGETIFFFNEKDAVVRYSCKVDMISLYHQLGLRLAPEDYDQQEIICKNKKLLIKEIKARMSNKLTNREIEAVSLNIYGFSSIQAGKLLFISHRTIETHLFRAFHELGCHNKQQCLETLMTSQMLPLFQDLAKLIMRRHAKTK